MAIYDINGDEIIMGGSVTVSGGDFFVNSVSHRGATNDGKLIGYIRAKTAGFNCGENDINFTSDGYVIMRHDGTITHNGTTYNINEITYEQLMEMDSTIPTLQQWLECMKCIELIPYIDTKRWSGTWSMENLQLAVDIVKSYGYADKCTWVISTINEADTILASIPNARIGWLALPTEGNITSVLNRKTDKNELFFDSDCNQITTEQIQNAITNGIKVEAYTITSASDFERVYAISPYFSGFTCNYYVVPSNILRAKYIAD